MTEEINKVDKSYTPQKKGLGIILTYTGIILTSLNLDFPIDKVIISFSGIPGLILIYLGLIPFFKEQNALFRRCRTMPIAGLILYALQIFLSYRWSGNVNTLILMFHSIFAVMIMHLSYSYIEALVLQGKFLKLEVKVPPLRTAFFIFCIFLAASVVTETFEILILTIVAKFLFYISAIYFASTLDGLRKFLYPTINS